MIKKRKKRKWKKRDKEGRKTKMAAREKKVW